MKLRYYLRGLGIGILVTAFLMGAVQGDGKTALSDEEIRARAAELGMVESMVLSDLEGQDSAKKAPEGSNPEVADAGSREPSGSSELPVASEPSVSSEAAENPQPSGSKNPSETSESSGSKNPSETSESSGSKDSSETPEPSGSKNPSETPESSGSKDSSETPESSGSKNPSETLEPPESSESPETPKTSESKAPVEPLEPSENTANSVTITIKRGDSSVAVSKALEAAGLVADAKAYDRFLCAGGYDKTLSVGSYEIPAGADDEEIARILTGKK